MKLDNIRFAAELVALACAVVTLFFLKNQIEQDGKTARDEFAWNKKIHTQDVLEKYEVVLPKRIRRAFDISSSTKSISDEALQRVLGSCGRYDSKGKESGLPEPTENQCGNKPCEGDLCRDFEVSESVDSPESCRATSICLTKFLNTMERIGSESRFDMLDNDIVEDRIKSKYVKQYELWQDYICVRQRTNEKYYADFRTLAEKLSKQSFVCP